MKKAFKFGLLLSPFFLMALAFFFIIFMVLFLLIFIFNINEEDEMIGGNFICSTTGEVNREKWDSFWNSSNANNLKGYGDLVLNYSEEIGIDPVLASAVMLQESGSGKFTSKNNPGGIMDWEQNFSVKRQFATMEEGIKYTIENLGRRILGDGLVTIEQLGSRYAPLGAANDPQGLNKNWVPGVTKFAENLGGLTMNCSPVLGGGNVEIIGKKAWPVPFTKNLTSGYGQRWGRNHNGVDIAWSGVDRTEVVAFTDGTVDRVVTGCFVGNMSCGGGFGNLVVIKHKDNISTYYAHLSSVTVTSGQKVQAGQVIGTVGNTGHSYGAHLHFEIRIANIPVDPYNHLTEFNPTKTY